LRLLLVIPEKFGGFDLTPLGQVAVFEPIAKTDAALSLLILIQNTLAARPIVEFGTSAQKDKYLRLMAEGKLIGCIGLSEPGVGSDLMNLTCKAEKVDGGWKINGEKLWISSAKRSDIIDLAARTGTPESGARGISLFIAPLDHTSPNLKIKTVAKHGQHASQFCSVVFTDYFIPDDALLGELNEGQKVLRDTLNLSRVWIAAQGTGIALHAYELAIQHVNQREMFGKKLVDLPLMARNLDHAKREIDIARLLVRKAAWAEQTNEKYAHVWSALAKVVASEVAFLVSHDSALFHGAMGYTMETEIGYVASDAEVLRTYEGSRETLTELALKYLTEEQLQLVWPRADHPIKPIGDLPTAEKVIRTVEGWEIKKRNIAGDR